MVVVHLTLDDRERALSAALEAAIHAHPRGRAAFVLETRRLVLGDVSLRAPDAPDAEILVERKREDDLMASLFDGRLSEQGARLVAHAAAERARGRRCWIVLLVEGGGRPATSAPPPLPSPEARHLLKTLVSLAADPAHLCLRAADVIESAAYLLTLWKTLVLARPSDASAGDPLPPPPRRTGPIYNRQLACVPGMSPARARLVRDLYPTCVALCAAVQSDAAGVAARLGEALRNRPLGERLVAALLDNPEPPPHAKRPRPESPGNPSPREDAPPGEARRRVPRRPAARRSRQPGARDRLPGPPADPDQGGADAGRLPTPERP